MIINEKVLKTQFKKTKKKQTKKGTACALMALFLRLPYGLVANFLKTWDVILMTLRVHMDMQPQSAFQDTWLLLRRWL